MILYVCEREREGKGPCICICVCNREITYMYAREVPVCIQLCVCENAQMYMCGIQRLKWDVLLNHAPFYSLETGSLTELGLIVLG